MYSTSIQGDGYSYSCKPCQQAAETIAAELGPRQMHNIDWACLV